MHEEPDKEARGELGIWTSAGARDQLLAAYEARLDTLAEELERHRVATSFGVTQVLIGGEVGAPALLFVHGTNGDAAQMAGAYAPWCETHRCVFVDVPGEANPSSGGRIPRGDDSLARWLGELLDGLGLERVALFGMSGGSYVALRGALGLPGRIRAIVGLVPEGFCELGAIPEPTPANAEALVHAMTEPDSGFPRAMVELMTAAMCTSLAALREPLRLGPLFRPEEFAAFDVPVMLVAGGRDRVFPGATLLARAREVLPRVHTLLLPEANHVHLELYRGATMERVAEFLAAQD